ncbi:hypothetical protein Lalb_Chr09g0327301 [Lupinus albus]|uniref:Uncharacterized protein n=1 Tax=Lupinus albus TaxID=3870 RepID=A0A6A4Q0Z7_LUPAL|nr:hypothetical protein Lalb_Chr09g0327301 [Lupinus albus]
MPCDPEVTGHMFKFFKQLSLLIGKGTYIYHSKFRLPFFLNWPHICVPRR